MITNKKTRLVLMALVVVAAVIGFEVFSGHLLGTRTETANDRRSQRTERRKGRRYSAKEKPSFRKEGAAKRGDKPKFEFDSPDHPYSEEDKRVAMAVQDALDEDNLDDVLSATEVALKSKNPDVRLNAVEALGWYGEQTLPELTVCMADPDEDVAQAAMSHWEQGVSDMDKSDDKLRISLYALNAITDEDTLTMVSSHFAHAALDLIDGEEDESVAFEKRVEIVQALAETIEEGKENCSAAAQEAYEEITGNKWMGVDEAEKYLNDPDNYEAPESDNESDDESSDDD